MEHFIVSARKYRPQTFEEVVGQQAITNTLENAIKSNHLAQALLFTGPRGVGKTTCARILAKKINQNTTTSSNLDEDFAFNIFELDAASNNSVDDIRSLTDQVRIPPQTGKYKVYIIDEVHMLSQAAFNAFLKTLEEPPKHAIFILATTEKHKIIPTILSRCQIFDFKRIGVLDAKKYLEKIALEENITAEDDALHIIAQKADGAMRDALSIFDRVVSFSGNKLTRKAVTENLNVLDYDEYFKTTDLLLNNNIPEVLIHFNTILSKGFEGHHFINGLASHFRDLMVAKDKITIELLEVGDNAKKKYLEQSQKCDIRFLLQAIDMANDCDLKYKGSKNQRLLVELTLMQLASITFDGEKKNNKPYIIASVTFKNTKKRARKPIDVPLAVPKKEEAKTLDKPVLTTKKELVKPVLNTERRRSALSLKSIEKDNEVKDLEVVIEEVNGPADDFTESKMQELWAEYSTTLFNDGKKIIASILNCNKPKLVNNNIHFEVPAAGMRDQLESGKPILMKFLKEKLNNFKIDLVIHLNEEETKKYAYTPFEKYEKLKEKNSAMELLKRTFDLDF
ncbi:DNA polymerase III subunit gamma/tau [Lutibacter sp.]|uniref:DNA polymerase III subunit gamma/tau n=1 Tax=Lutibacter sp. TaxID=1925666 RepID=UPI0035622AEA